MYFWCRPSIGKFIELILLHKLSVYVHKALLGQNIVMYITQKTKFEKVLYRSFQ